MPPLNTRIRQDHAFKSNGWKNEYDEEDVPSFSQQRKHKKDIAERGMDEEVHDFVKEVLPPLNTRIRQDHAFKNNGWKNVYPEASFSQRKHHHRS